MVSTKAQRERERERERKNFIWNAEMFTACWTKIVHLFLFPH